MARQTIFAHPKFRRLVYLLGEPVPHVLGYLECMWHVCYESGNPVLGDELDVELAAQWPAERERGKLATALVDVGFIDRGADDKLEVHDLWHHAPEYVIKRRKRESERKNKYTPRDRPHTAAWRGELGGRCPPNGAERRTVAELGTPPTPTPLLPLTPSREGEDVIATKPARKPRKSRTGECAEPAIPSTLDTPEFRTAWSEWEQYRRERRKPLTPSTASKQLKQLEGFGAAGAVASISASITHGWTGLFEPKLVETPASPTTPPRPPEAILEEQRQKRAQFEAERARARAEYTPMGKGKSHEQN